MITGNERGQTQRVSQQGKGLMDINTGMPESSSWPMLARLALPNPQLYERVL